MSKVKQVLIDSMTPDRTGSVLSPHPKQRLREHKSTVEPTTGPRAVERRAARARGMYAQRRWIRAVGSKRKFRFRTQTTEQFKNGVVPGNDGYEGRVELDEFERIVGGRCSCPDWKKGGAKLSNGLPFCKHMEYARLHVLQDGLDSRGPITLEIDQDGLRRVKENGRFREPKTGDPNAAREWLLEHGYRLVATEARPEGLVRMIYA